MTDVQLKAWKKMELNSTYGVTPKIDAIPYTEIIEKAITHSGMEYLEIAKILCNVNLDLIIQLQKGDIAIKPTKNTVLLNDIIKIAFPRIRGQFSGALYYFAMPRDKDLCEYDSETDLLSYSIEDFIIKNDNNQFII